MDVPGHERALGVNRLQDELARWPYLDLGELDGLQLVDAFLADRRFAYLAKIQSPSHARRARRPWSLRLSGCGCGRCRSSRSHGVPYCSCSYGAHRYCACLVVGYCGGCCCG